METRAASFLPDDVVLEILYRVSTDVTTLFRCATTCKRWHALIAERSFVNRVWPQNACHPSYLVGFLDRQPYGRMDISSPYPLFFVPPPTGSVFGAHRRFLASVIPNIPDGFLEGADALASDGGLLLIRLKRGIHNESVHLAVCDLITGRWNVLPPLKCRVYRMSCVIVTGEDCGPSLGPYQHRPSSSDHSPFFKVLAIVLNSYKRDDDQVCDLYTFSSTKPHWSAPTKCFDRMWRLHNSGFVFRVDNNVALCRVVAHWFVPYIDCHEQTTRYYTYEVNVKTCNASLMELSIPADQLDNLTSLLTLGVTNDGSLSLLYMYKEGGIRRIDMWKRGDAIDDRAWLRTRVVDIKQPRREWNPCFTRMWLGKKSGILLIIDEFGACTGSVLKLGRWRRRNFGTVYIYPCLWR